MNESIRSLPPSKMAEFKRMFEKKDEESSTPKPAPRPATRFDTKIDNSSQSSPSKQKRPERSPVRPPKPNVSPTRNPRTDVSPNRQTGASDLTPKPMPRSSVDHRSDQNFHGISALPIGKLGQVAGVVAMGGDDAAANCVSKLVGHLEHNSPNVDNNDTSRNQAKEMKHNQTHSDPKSEIPEYAKLWDSGTPKQNNLPVQSVNKDNRPVSVLDRLKLFDNLSQSSPTPSPNKPAKPPPPVTKVTVSEGQRSNKPGGLSSNKVAEDEQKVTKVRPSRPPIRQRSLVEKKTQDTNIQHADQISASDKNNAVTKKPLKPPSKPPSKPPRTGAHDDYIRVKKGKENETQKEKETKTQSDEEDYEDCDFIHVPKKKTDAKADKAKTIQGSKKLQKPQRPPPPRKKPRPFSIATDKVSSLGSDERLNSDSDGHLSDSHSFYESLEEPVTQTSNHLNDPIKHWDLPRFSHPEPIRRSLSDDCIPKAVDDAGNIVYFDPKKLVTQDSTGYDIYVDSAGYAVPSRLVRRQHSTNDDEMENEPSRPIGDRVKSKFKKFKNLFSEAEKSPPVCEKPSNQGSTKRKLTIIRKKVEQVFEGLQGSRRKKRRESRDENEAEDEADQSIQDDQDSRVDDTEIRKRVAYSRSVRIKTSASIKESRKYEEKVYPQLFEYAMIVSLRPGDTGEYEPYVIYKFPEIRNYKLTMEGKLYPCSEAMESNVSVPQFCFPDAANFKPSSSTMKSQCYLFVLTNIDGGRVYGYCRRLIPPKSPNKVPEVICIISPVDAFYMYNTLLQEIEKKRILSLDLAQELIAAAFGRPLPSPGKESIVRTLDMHGEMETIFLTRETDSRIENVNCECLLTALGSDKVLKVFASILLERSVLFCAKHLSVLSSTIHALSSLLYPFSWQHTFIPVLPTAMLDVICSPTPYIIGITSNHLPKALTLPLEENVLIVDLDKKSFVRSEGDEGTLLPTKIEKALKTVLNMCRIDIDAKSNPNLMISEAFLLFFVEAIGHYGQYIHTQQGGKKLFKKEEFIKGAASSSLEQLLEWFVETQMFEVFMTKELEKSDWGNTLELFESRVLEHKQSKPSRLKWKRQVMKR